MTIKKALYILTFQRPLSTVANLLSNSFRIHTNHYTVTYEKFRRDLLVMNEKLLYYINEYFQMNSNKSGSRNGKKHENKTPFLKKRIAGLFPPCYSQVVFKFCVFMNNFDYISIPIPIKNSKQIKQKYYFFISENKTDLILCHPFYKHYIEDISFHLQIPYLICYEKPDILTSKKHLDQWNAGKEQFASTVLYQSPDDIKQKKHINQGLHRRSDNFNETDGERESEKESKNESEKESKKESEKWKKKWEEWLSKQVGKEHDDTATKGIEKLKDETSEEESSITVQLSKENVCDKSIRFFISKILEQSINLNKICNLTDKDIALIGVPANKIEYYDILFSLIHSKATIIFPEVNKKKVLHNTNYMSWFKNHMEKKKENNFSVHPIIKKTHSLDMTSDFAFIDGSSLFDEINSCKSDITVLILHNYLIRDFIYFWEHCEINKLTKQEFLQKKADKITKILINGNEIKPSIDKKYIEKITNIFKNAKIYQRYILQEIGTICVTPLDYIEQAENVKYQKNIAGYLMPNVKAEIDSETEVLKVKINYENAIHYNKHLPENNKNAEKDGINVFDENGFFKTNYVASINEDSLLTIKGYFNEIKNIPEEYNLYYKQQRDKMEKMPPGYLKRVRLHGRIWGNFHANKKNWKRKF